MPDYGHDLQFGFFLDPTTGTPERTVEIAHILDDLGYDLIGIQAWPMQIDHNDRSFSPCCGGFNPLTSMRVHVHLSTTG
jgi:hypothetical protein